MKKLLICLLALGLAAAPAALADTVTVDGTVVSTETVPVVSPADGVLHQVFFRVGDHVSVGAEAATLYAQPVLAEQAGTVKVFGAQGEAVETLISRYGAVMYIEPDCEFTLSASANYAYDAMDNKIIHPGETVYLRCGSNGAHTGMGTVTAVNGNSYTVEVAEGRFESGENVYIYRDETYAAKSRIGRGSALHASPVAVTGLGAGRISAIHVADGAHVEAGDALFDTVAVGMASSYSIVSTADGTVAEVLVSPGAMVTQGAVVAMVYPDAAMRLEVVLSEHDLRDVREGTRVSVEFTSGETAEGEIERISGVARAGADAEEDVCFAAYVRFDAPETVRYGMTAKVTTIEEE